MGELMALSLGLKFLGFILDVFKASDETKRKFLDLVEASRNEGLISVQAYETFKKQRQELEERAKNGN